MGAPGETRVVLCGGGSCRRKQPEAYAGLRSRLERARVAVEEVRCLGSCSGPTAVVEAGGSVAAFEKLRKGGVQKDLVALVTGRDRQPSGRLAKRALGGGRLAKVEGRLARRLGRRAA